MYLIFGIFKWLPHQNTDTTTKTLNIDEPKSPEVQTIAQDIQKEMARFNWGAFFMPGLWALLNKSYIIFFMSIFIFALASALKIMSFTSSFEGISVLVIPVSFLIRFCWACYCGARGNQWAWEKCKWKSLTHFTSVQQKWAVAGIIWTVISIFFIICIYSGRIIKADNSRSPSMEAASSSALYTDPAEATLTLPSPPATYPTSFDCNSASITPSAKYICENSTLAALDIRMANIYAEVISPLDLSEKRALISEQKKWLHERNQCTSQENPFNCMLEAYSNRIKELNFYKTNGFSEPKDMPNSASATASETSQDEAPQKEEVLPSKPEEEQQEQVYLKPRENLEPENKPKTNQKENTPDYLKKYIE